MDTKISLAPLQGYTDWVFRKAYQKYFGCVDQFYTPYIVLQNDGTIKSSHRREVEHSIDSNNLLVPQILCGSASEFMILIEYLAGLGYRRINWNLGCPYPMVTRRIRGAGLLPHPDIIRDILIDVFTRFSLSLSVKMRLGYDDCQEIFPVLNVMNDFPIEEIIIHPRIGKQLYKGSVNTKVFEQCIETSVHPLAYNGDIFSETDLKAMKELFPDISHWMLGRGILSDLWLPNRIKGLELPDYSLAIMNDFHDEIFNTYSEILCGEAQLLMKMRTFWEYFAQNFNNAQKVYKGIKKSKNIEKYQSVVSSTFQAAK